MAGADEVQNLSPGALYSVMFHWDGTRWMRVHLPPQVDTGFNALATSPTHEVWATSENPYDYALDGGAGSSVWHRASG